MKNLFVYVLLFFSLTSSAMMNDLIGTEWYVTFRDWYGEDFVIKDYQEPHSDGIKRILIGHMVTPPFNIAKLIKYAGEHTYAYHFCLGAEGECEGKCYEFVPTEVKVRLLRDHNDGSCGVGLMTNTSESYPEDISEDVVESWARMLAHIALRLNIGEKLVWGENIIGQHDLEPERFPESPGHKFYKRNKDRILELANEFMENPISNIDGKLL